PLDPRLESGRSPIRSAKSRYWHTSRTLGPASSPDGHAQRRHTQGLTFPADPQTSRSPHSLGARPVASRGVAGRIGRGRGRRQHGSVHPSAARPSSSHAPKPGGGDCVVPARRPRRGGGARQGHHRGHRALTMTRHGPRAPTRRLDAGLPHELPAMAAGSADAPAAGRHGCRIPRKPGRGPQPAWVWTREHLRRCPSHPGTAPRHCLEAPLWSADPRVGWRRAARATTGCPPPKTSRRRFFARMGG
ncbi:MAG: hypothetical protein RL153_865, partial [Verrucomicrobiota bacterium]